MLEWRAFIWTQPMALSQAPKHSQPQTVATSACPERERERDLHHRHLVLHQGDMASYTSTWRETQWLRCVECSTSYVYTHSATALCYVYTCIVVMYSTCYVCRYCIIHRERIRIITNHVMLGMWHDCCPLTVTSAHHRLRSPSYPAHSGNSYRMGWSARELWGMATGGLNCSQHVCWCVRRESNTYHNT